jgi:uncharacterized protein (DUF1697 family)
MSRYAVFLRAVNVGGRSTVRMNELVENLTRSGLEDVISFRQSGNLILGSSTRDTRAIMQMVTGVLQRLNGIKTEVFVVPMAELALLVDASPFEGQLAEGDRGFATFISPVPRIVPELPTSMQEGIVMIGILDDMVLSIVRKDVGSGPLNDLVEKKLGVIATTRNWSTVTGLVEKDR